MAIGLTRSKNLTERNLNLVNALQKLYAPSIEDDINLFSLSSSVESVVISGTFNNQTSQIFGVAGEVLTSLTGQKQNRTKFLTKFFSFTDLNEVYFSKYSLVTPAGGAVVGPKTSQNGEIHLVQIIDGGQGFYFLNTSGGVESAGESIEVENVRLRGSVSGSEGARAKILFVRHSVVGLSSGELTKFTPGSTDRYSVQSIVITNPSSGYIIDEPLEIIESNVTKSSDGSTIALRKQKGQFFAGQPELLRPNLYTYQVRGANNSGFFLYDPRRNEYIFIQRDTPEDLGFSQADADSIQLRRYDGISFLNFEQFKFAQSRIRLRGYGADAGFQISGDSISGEIQRVANATNNAQIRTQSAIQNTKRPTLANSDENILGYVYNSFQGQDVVIWQRVVLRDPDYILNPENPDFTSNSITGSRLRDNVVNFELQALNSPAKIRVPGLFIKVGQDYFRAFSTTDKPFFAETASGQPLNPQLSAGVNRYTLSAESVVTGSNSELYSYDTIISELAQRIAYDDESLEPDPKLRSKNGAFYYHRATAPQRRTIPTRRAGANISIFGVPLFSLTN
jgi:hypothetical protein